MRNQIVIILVYIFSFYSCFAESKAEKSMELARDYAKHLHVFEANREFQLSLDLNPHNNIYRSQYAWHLQKFFLISEALYQFSLILPTEPNKRLLYQVIGWDAYNLGQLDQSIWAFSHIYDIPPLTLSNQFLVVKKLFQCEQLMKIDELEKSLQSANQDEAIEIQKQIFESYTYIGDLKKAKALALEILSKYPDEYMVRYHYAHLLYEKKQYVDAKLQFDILIAEIPNNAFLYWSLGQVFEDMGSYQLAQEAYQKALSYDSNPRTEWAVARILSKLKSCSSAFSLSNQIVVDPPSALPAELSKAEIYLNCEDFAEATDIYRKILSNYPYNRQALWGLLKSSTHTRNTNDARLTYTRWPVVWFGDPLQNRLAELYRQPQITLPTEYYRDNTHFNRISVGLDYNTYLLMNTRAYAKAYYTQFSKKHFDTINRGSVLASFNTVFNKYFESHIEFIGNFYDHLQHHPMPSGQNLYAKGVFNYHFHLIFHKLPEFVVDLGYDYYDVIDTVPPFYNPVYNYSNQIGATSLNIRTADWNVFTGFTNEKIYLTANFVYGNYTYDNVKKTCSLRAGYRFYDIPSSSVYYNYFYLDFKHPAPLFSQNGYTESAYYDPINFQIHALGIDSSYDISQAYQVGGEAALIYVPQCTNFGCSSFAYLKYLHSDHFSCRLDLRFYYQAQGVSRTGITGDFHAENASFRMNYEF